MKYVCIERPDGPCWGVVKGEDVLTLSKPPFDGLEYDGGKLPLSQCRLPALPPKLSVWVKTMWNTPESWAQNPLDFRCCF